MEHLQHFGLSQDPFRNEPDLRFYYESTSHSEAQRRVERGLRQSKGLCILTGDAGTGKTLLARRILDELEEELFEASLIVMLPGAASAGSVLSRFARQLGVDGPHEDRSALLAQVYDQLAVIREDGRHAILILDDAHVLGQDAMVEVAGLVNLEYEDRRLLSLLLVGLPELDSELGRNAALGQRVDVRVDLAPLDFENAIAYVSHRISVVSGPQGVVPKDSMSALFQFSRGRPRLLNTICDNALFEAYLGGRMQLSPTDIQRAAADLGIGPDPGTTYTQHLRPDLPQDPAEESALELSMPIEPLSDSTSSSIPIPGEELGGDSQVDLGALLDSGGDSGSELATVLNLDPTGPGGGTLDLDAEVEAALAEQAPAVSPQFAELDDDVSLAEATFEPDNAPATPPPQGMAEATRLVLPDDGPPKEGADDELDDLFVELIDE